MIVAAVIAICGWNTPGADPTTSPISETLAAMGIYSPALAAKIAAGEYDELVTMRRNDRRAYGMTSGNAKWCAGEIDTSRWAEDQEEQGRVYRVDGAPAVVWYWRCKNMSLWRGPVIGGWTPIAAPAYMAGSDLRTGGPIGFAYATPIPLAMVPAGAVGGYGGGSWGAAAGFGGGGGGYVQQTVLCDCVPTPPCVPAVPEPMTAVLLIGGLAAAAVWSKRA